MNEVLFKTTAIGGFSKSDVLAFIDKQDKQFKDREKDLLSQLDSLRTGLRNETQHSSKLAENLAAMEKEFSAEKQLHSKTSMDLKSADDTLSRAKAEVSAEILKRDTKIKSLQDQLSELNIKLQQADLRALDANKKADETENKLNLIDKTEDQIGRALLEAQKTADNIIENAKNTAESIISNAQGEADGLIENTNAKIKKIKEDAQTKLTAVLKQVKDFENDAKNAHQNAENYLKQVTSSYINIENDATAILEVYQDAFKYNPNEAIPVRSDLNEQSNSEDDKKDEIEEEKTTLNLDSNEPVISEDEDKPTLTFNFSEDN